MKQQSLRRNQLSWLYQRLCVFKMICIIGCGTEICQMATMFVVVRPHLSHQSIIFRLIFHHRVVYLSESNRTTHLTWYEFVYSGWINVCRLKSDVQWPPAAIPCRIMLNLCSFNMLKHLFAIIIIDLMIVISIKCPCECKCLTFALR